VFNFFTPYLIRIGRLLCPFKKCVCKPVAENPNPRFLTWRAVIAIMRILLYPHVRIRRRKKPHARRVDLIFWQVPSLLHSNRVTSNNVVLAAVPNCRWVWIHALFSVLLIALGFGAPRLNKVAGTFLFGPCVRVTFNKRAVLCHIEVTRADGKWLAAVVIK
jgi:hypothetical protein